MRDLRGWIREVIHAETAREKISLVERLKRWISKIISSI